MKDLNKVMEDLTVKSWIGKKVRIKREYIKRGLAYDEVYNDDDVIIDIIEYDDGYEYVDTSNGLNGLVDNPTDAVFHVKMDIYGVDLFNHRRDGLVIGDVEPTHQIIIEMFEGSNKIGYPYLWGSEFFEEVN